MSEWIRILVHDDAIGKGSHWIDVNMDRIDSISFDDIVINGTKYSMPSAQAEKLDDYMHSVGTVDITPDLED